MARLFCTWAGTLLVNEGMANMAPRLNDCRRLIGKSCSAEHSKSGQNRVI